ncbi:MAG TPA: GlsB/YeaQ/YmgE family stress response membrane protein, partial [Candidatus Dormibacteraeota bacterium]
NGMAITINGTAINLDWTTILIWCLVGLVAGFLASRVALGHGLGLFGDIVVGILGAFLGGFIASIFRINVQVIGHPIISETVMAFAGAVILLLVVRLVSGGGRKRRAT